MQRRAPRVRGIMVMGTTSDAGKSLLAAALCRVLARRGYWVQPFKAQNMSLNSIPAEDGGEIAVAQWVQCRAAGVPPTTLANPVLLKHEGPGVEIILRGQSRFRISSWRTEMPRRVPILRETVHRALAELEALGAVVVAEGAGSPAEMNLRATDLANFEVARRLRLPVVLVASLERGGAIAQLIGTLALLPTGERRLVRGLVLNQMRGDIRLLEKARTFLEEQTGIPVLGIVPHLDHPEFSWPEEDSLSLSRESFGTTQIPSRGTPRIGILRYPHISNFLDFTALRRQQPLALAWVEHSSQIEGLDALLLPGSRRTVDDLHWLREAGIERAIRMGLRRGLKVGGICGGYQMLGRSLVDPSGFEGPPGTTSGLGLLPVTTCFQDPKITRNVHVLAGAENPLLPPGSPVRGYEIRRGRVSRDRGSPIFFRPAGAADRKEQSSDRSPSLAEPVDRGCVARRGAIWGTAIHGVLSTPESAEGLLNWVLSTRRRKPGRDWVKDRPSTPPDSIERSIDLAADLIEGALDLKTLCGWLGPPS